MAALVEVAPEVARLPCPGRRLAERWGTTMQIASLPHPPPAAQRPRPLAAPTLAQKPTCTCVRECVHRDRQKEQGKGLKWGGAGRGGAGTEGSGMRDGEGTGGSGTGRKVSDETNERGRGPRARARTARSKTSRASASSRASSDGVSSIPAREARTAPRGPGRAARSALTSRGVGISESQVGGRKAFSCPLRATVSLTLLGTTTENLEIDGLNPSI